MLKRRHGKYCSVVKARLGTCFRLGEPREAVGVTTEQRRTVPWHGKPRGDLRPAAPLAVVALACYMAVLLFALLTPSAGVPSASVGWLADVMRRLGAPEVVLVPERVEFVANVLILVPATALGALRWRSLTWRDWTAYGFVFSGWVELLQGLFLDERSATHVDVVANTLGALGGAALVTSVARLRRSQPSRIMD